MRNLNSTKKMIAIVLSVLSWWLGSSAYADETTAVSFLQHAYDITQNASFVALAPNPQVPGQMVCRIQWKAPDGFVFRRQDVLKSGVESIHYPDGFEQSNRWNRDGFFLIANGNAIQRKQNNLQWLPNYDFTWIERIRLTDVLLRNIPCHEVRAEVKIPDKEEFTVCYFVDRKSNFIHEYQIISKGQKVEQFTFGKIDFSPDLSSRDFAIPSSVRVDKSLTGPITTEVVQQLGLYGAKRDLQKAMDTSRNIPFSAQLEDKIQSDGIKQILYQRPGVKGTTPRMLRIDYANASNPENVFWSKVINQEGHFEIFGSDVVKSQYPDHNIPPYEYLNMVPKALVTVKAGSDAGIPVFIYTLTYPADHPLPDYVDRTQWPYVNQYRVRQDRGFLYAWQGFNRNGEQVYSAKLTSLAFEPEPEASRFALPKWKKIHSSKDLEKIRAEYFGKEKRKASAGPGWFQRQEDRVGQFFERNIDSILSWGGKITFWLAIIAAILAIFLKVRSRLKAGR